MSTRSAISATSTARRCSSICTPAASSATAFFHRALELEALLQLLRRRHELARPRQVHRDGRLALWRLDPARRDRHMASLEQLAQPLAQRSLDRAELEWQLELRIEVAVIHAADLDGEPPAEDLPFS